MGCEAGGVVPPGGLVGVVPPGEFEGAGVTGTGVTPGTTTTPGVAGLRGCGAAGSVVGAELAPSAARALQVR